MYHLRRSLHLFYFKVEFNKLKRRTSSRFQSMAEHWCIKHHTTETQLLLNNRSRSHSPQNIKTDMIIGRTTHSPCSWPFGAVMAVRRGMTRVMKHSVLRPSYTVTKCYSGVTLCGNSSRKGVLPAPDQKCSGNPLQRQFWRSVVRY